MAAVPFTPEWLRLAFLPDVRLIDDFGYDFRSEVWEEALAQARDWAETALDVELTPQTHVERDDMARMGWAEGPIVDLVHKPVLSVEKLILKWGVTELLEIPTNWVQMYSDGQVQIVPSSGSFSTAQTQALGFFSLMVSQYRRGSYVPGMYEVHYTSGYRLLATTRDFTTTMASGTRLWTPSRDLHPAGRLTIQVETAPVADVTFTIRGCRLSDGKPLDGQVRGRETWAGETVTLAAGSTTVATVNEWGTIYGVDIPAAVGAITFSGTEYDTATVTAPRDVMGLLGRYAAIHVLNIAGDLVAGAGIANRSASIDGASTSVGTTASATNAGYGARIIQYRKEIRDLLPLVRRRLHGMTVRVG